MIALSFFFGALATLPLLAIRWQMQFTPNLVFFWEQISEISFLPTLISLSFFLAFLEEFLKHFAVLRLGKRLRIHFDQIVDGIIYSVSAALGFAFAENILFFLTAMDYYLLTDAHFWNTVSFRSLFSMLGHSLFSGIFGLFWGHAFLSTAITPKHTRSVSGFFFRFGKRFFQTLSFHIIRHHILHKRPSLHGHEKADLVFEGLILATLMHTLFNIIIEYSALMLLPVLLLPVFFFLSSQFSKKYTTILHPLVSEPKK